MNDIPTCSACGQTMPEPPYKSVALDRDGDAWQRQDYVELSWRMPGMREYRTWADVVRDHGPMNVIHNPEEN